MWTVEDDLLSIDRSKDVCCNTCVYFSINERGSLDMTVCNRSNDLVWGMLGANVVHFSILQEYMAAKIGIRVGTYHQFTNNLHVYTDNWKPISWLKSHKDSPSYRSISVMPLIKNVDQFDEELPQFVELNDHKSDEGCHWNEPFLQHVAQQMCYAFDWYKAGDFDAALHRTLFIKDESWKIVSMQWLKKRMNKRTETKA